MTFPWPQTIWLMLTMLGISIDIYRHGKPREGHYNFPISMIGVSIGLILLIWGGFFTPFVMYWLHFFSQPIQP